MIAPKHAVTFTAEDGWFIAHCSCGWKHALQPWQESRYFDTILLIGLEHTLQGETLPTKTRHTMSVPIANA